MPIRPRAGIDLVATAERLREVALAGRNVASGAAGATWNDYRNLYLEWVHTARRQVKDAFDDRAAWAPLHSEAYWYLARTAAAPPRWSEFITTEAVEQASWIEGLAGRLTALSERLAAADGPMVVLDTNVLLHFQQPDQVDWLLVVGQRPIRLVLPLRVIEELDEKKYTARDHLADRARRLLSSLRELLAPTSGLPVPLVSGVTIEVPVDREPRRRTLDADEEVLATCEELMAVGVEVRLVTDDTGMTLRARARDIPVIGMPPQYRRHRPIGEDEGREVPT